MDLPRSRRGRWWPVMVLGTVLVISMTLTGRAGEPAEVKLRRTATEFLFYKGEVYYPSGRVPNNEESGTGVGQTELQSFMVAIKLSEVGTIDIPALYFECQGVRYVLPAHRLIVVPLRSEDEMGTFIDARPDPNGSGDVCIVIASQVAGETNHASILVDRTKLPENVTIYNERITGGDSDHFHRWHARLTLHNGSDKPFTVKPELFKNLPEVKAWPITKIEPTPANEPEP